MMEEITLSFNDENDPFRSQLKEINVLVETNEDMDIASIRSMMTSILGCTTLQGLAASTITGPVVSAIIIFSGLAFAAGVVKFSIDFCRKKPNQIKGFSTLGLSSFALSCCITLVVVSLCRLFSNPTLLGMIPLISGFFLCSAPLVVLRFSARSSASKEDPLTR